MKNKLDIVQEENLYELIRHFPVIFGKSHKGYREKDAEINAWNEIANSLDFIADGMYYTEKPSILLIRCQIYFLLPDGNGIVCNYLFSALLSNFCQDMV